MKKTLIDRLKKQQYGLVGSHSGVKLCHWMKQSLLHKRNCYKQDFYGIQSHRCLQMTPTVNHCNHNCLFCWRYQGFTEHVIEKPDDPSFILEQSIKEQQRLITGFKGDERCDLKRWEEANKPNMVACSLSGEPTLYPRLGEFFELCHKKGMTTFLVSNGTNPEVLKEMDPLPDQLYISLIAPTKETYKKLCVPYITNGWEKIQETLELLPSLDTRTVIRQTLIKDWNFNHKYIENYAKFIKKAEPLFVEPKGYVFVGSSRQRMNLSNMPSHQEIKEFGLKLSNEIGYEFINEKKDSRVVLLCKVKKPKRINK
ncbi:4-demethylwyosine synthase TYW1 [Thermoplasmatales archaeon ex4572_165]|nr:MAG: 4-demethylwyosine synthase TYW1 [Thermoplasmatales archaeon ex4572_165]RLF59822.1 MAG: 4-demethylwyosine synthase TYW1 [Thermoplasmata archaeon]